MRPELCQRPIGDVFPTVSPVLVVGVEGKSIVAGLSMRAFKSGIDLLIINANAGKFLSIVALPTQITRFSAFGLPV